LVLKTFKYKKKKKKLMTVLVLVCHPNSAGVIDWGACRLVAYGSFSYVVILDPVSLKVVCPVFFFF
jgi:hypothetical protein